jgi:DNA-binding beta-propeller fold protein YncE
MKNYQKAKFALTTVAWAGTFLAPAWAEETTEPKPEDVILSVPGLMPSATLEMTDEPGTWFKDPTDGDALVVVKPGEAVLIKQSDSNTEHTITSLIWQPGAAKFPVDQDEPSSVSVTQAFDKPGLYVFTCKVHPYMFGAVIVDDPATEGLDLGAEIQLVNGAKVPTTSDIAKKLLRTYFVATTPALWRDYGKPTWEAKLPELPVNLGGTVIKLSALNVSAPNKLSKPATPGVGEVWVNTQFEKINGKTKPGAATQVDAATWSIKKKVKGVETNMNNPHNMWTDNAYKYIYQTEWFDKRLTVFDRESGKIYGAQTVGNSPSHVMTRPSDGMLTVAINNEDRLVKLSPGQSPTVMGSIKVGTKAGPHGHHVTHDGKYAITPNALAGSVSVVDLASEKVTEIPTGGVIPIAVWSDPQSKFAYAANLLGTPPLLATLTVVDLESKKKIKDINLAEDYDPVSGESKGEAYGLLPIQTPVSPDGKYVVTANTLSGTITILDTAKHKVVKSLPCDPGCHGVNFGLKKGGGYYAYVASKFANDLIVIDMDKLEIVGRVLLADAKDAEITANNGMGGQGVLPLPLAEHGHLAPTLKLQGTGKLSPEVEGWLKQLSKEQKGSAEVASAH